LEKKDWNKLKGYLETAAIHQLAISSENVTDTTVTNLNTSIETNDWTTAREWADLARNEIRIQKGRKKQIISAVDEIYRPLYLENIQNEVAGKGMMKAGEFRVFQRDEWIKIKTSTAYLMLKDKRLKDELERFYTKIERFNELPNTVIKICEKIYRKKIKEHYGNNVINLHYFIKTTSGSGAPSITHLLPFGRHPMQVYESDQKPEPEYIQLMRTDNTGTKLTSKGEFDEFEKLYEKMKKEVQDNSTLKDVKKLYEQITSKNMELKEILIQEIQSAFKI